MAQVVVDSGVMRDKANTIKTASKSIQTLYAEMLQEVTATAGKMKGETIETQKNRFANMQTTFDTFAADMEKYGNFSRRLRNIMKPQSMQAPRRHRNRARFSDRG